MLSQYAFRSSDPFFIMMKIGGLCDVPSRLFNQRVSMCFRIYCFLVASLSAGYTVTVCTSFSSICFKCIEALLV